MCVHVYAYGYMHCVHVQLKRESKRFCDNAAKMLSVDPEALVGIGLGLGYLGALHCMCICLNVSMWVRGHANVCVCVCVW